MRTASPAAPDAPGARGTTGPGLHGVVMLEVNNHAPFGDNEEMLRLHLLSLLDSLRSPELDRAPTDDITAHSGTTHSEHEEHGR
ncbi:MAG: hypothetical protein OEW29_17865 [Acidimicrobiia bacterium]|nr:hypothetical protein [Acidimicrobiia bacterium]MDH4362957.1 hypothetical protein [Acidimicrobiia bacterium]